MSLAETTKADLVFVHQLLDHGLLGREATCVEMEIIHTMLEFGRSPLAFSLFFVFLSLFVVSFALVVVFIVASASSRHQALLSPREGVRNISFPGARHPLLTVGGSVLAPSSVQVLGAVACGSVAARLLLDRKALIEQLGQFAFFSRFALHSKPLSPHSASLGPGD